MTAINVCKVFKIKNLGEYHYLYLRTDVLLLTDVFEQFIKTCLEYYKLDPCHYFNAKLLINSINGKTMENLRKRINNSKDYLRCVSKPNFISQKIFSKNFIAVHQTKSLLTLNKPLYVGFNILELSKLLMCKFHYDYVKNKFDFKLLFTDTDSLVYEINRKNVYEECFKDRELFDSSEYPIDSKYYDSSNKKVIGKINLEERLLVNLLD